MTALELVTADGDLTHYTRDGDPDVFPGLVVGLGAVGVVTRVTVATVPAFDVRQDGYTGMDWDTTLANWETIQGAGYSVSLFTRWVDAVTGMFLVKTRVEPAAEFEVPAAFRAAVKVAEPPGPHFTAWNTPGPWHDHLAHFRLDATPSVGDELQSEYMVRRADAVAALTAVRDIGEQPTSALHVSEIRTVAADDLWLSPAYGDDRLCIHFTWQPKPAEVAALLPVIEERLAPFGARPHWGKLCTPDFPLDEVYPRLPEFRALVTELDPGGKFRNAYLDRHVFHGGLSPAAGR